MRIFISTGEVSGDLQGAMLVAALHRQASILGTTVEIVALGGIGMANAGATLLADTTTIGSMGLLEALPFVLPTLTIQRRAQLYLQQYPPDVIVLIDYMGPNVAIGSYVRKYLPQVPIMYYIAPQDWVWAPLKQNTQQLVSIIDRLLAIFPQEATYFESKGVDVTWVGHPLLDRMATAPSKIEARKELGLSLEDTIITLLPASRRQELKYLLPVMCEAAQTLQNKVPGVRFLVPLSLPIYREAIEAKIKEYNLRATIVEGKTIQAISCADLAITKSGTVNLEIALLKVPQVVIYRLHPFTMWVARNLLKFNVPFISPTNLILMESVVPELLQEQVTSNNIVAAALDILLNPEKQAKIQQQYQQLRESLGEEGVSDRAAKEILQFAKNL